MFLAASAKGGASSSCTCRACCQGLLYTPGLRQELLYMPGGDTRDSCTCQPCCQGFLYMPGAERRQRLLYAPGEIAGLLYMPDMVPARSSCMHRGYVRGSHTCQAWSQGLLYTPGGRGGARQGLLHMPGVPPGDPVRPCQPRCPAPPGAAFVRGGAVTRNPRPAQRGRAGAGSASRSPEGGAAGAGGSGTCGRRYGLALQEEDGGR